MQLTLYRKVQKKEKHIKLAEAKNKTTKSKNGNNKNQKRQCFKMS
jgi:hypothetical protein